MEGASPQAGIVSAAKPTAVGYYLSERAREGSERRARGGAAMTIVEVTMHAGGSEGGKG